MDPLPFPQPVYCIPLIGLLLICLQVAGCSKAGFNSEMKGAGRHVFTLINNKSSDNGIGLFYLITDDIASLRVCEELEEFVEKHVGGSHLSQTTIIIFCLV